MQNTKTPFDSADHIRRLFPSYIEEYAANYIAQDAALQHRLGQTAHASFLIDTTRDIRARKSFERANQYFPEFPARGQIELLSAAAAARPGSDAGLMTEREAEVWRAKFIKQVTELNRTFNTRPRSLNGWHEGLRNYLSRHPKLQDMASLNPKSSVVENFAAYLDNGHALSAYLSAAQNLKYQALGYGKVVRGNRGRRQFFIRQFAKLLYCITGSWEVDTVHEITELVFACKLERHQIRRHTRGLVEGIPNPLNALSHDEWKQAMESLVAHH